MATVRVSHIKERKKPISETLVHTRKVSLGAALVSLPCTRAALLCLPLRHVVTTIWKVCTSSRLDYAWGIMRL